MSSRGLFAAAVDEVRANRARTALSVLSIAIGVSSLTWIVATGELARSAAVASIERQSGRQATVEVGISVPAWSSVSTAYVAHVLSDVLVSDGAEATSALATTSAEISRGGATYPTRVVAAEPALATIRRFRIVDGRWLQPSDAALLAPAVVVNGTLAEAVGGISASDESATTLTLAERVSVTVVGVVEDGDSGANAYVVPATLGRWSTPTDWRLVAWLPPASMDAASAHMQTIAHRLEAELDITRTDDPESVATLVSVIQLVLGTIAFLSLVTGAAGILNLGLATVRYRAREFALRRAFGATRRDVFSIVMVETTFVTTLAGVIGLAVAVVGTALTAELASAFMDPADFPPFPIWAAIMAVLLSALLGFLAGVAPARSASSRDIIRAIRD